METTKYFVLVYLCSVLIVSCTAQKEVDTVLVSRLNEYVILTDILLRNKDILMPINGKQKVNIDINNGAIRKDSLLFNKLPTEDFRVIKESFKNGLFGSENDGSIGLYQSGEIWYNIKFYNGGILDSSYNHAIVYDPLDKYKGSSFQFFLVKNLKDNWKYIISKIAFN